MVDGNRDLVTDLSRLLTERGMTRARLAATLDPPVSHTTVGRWLRGSTPYPRHALQIRRLLDGLPAADAAEPGFISSAHSPTSGLGGSGRLGGDVERPMRVATGSPRNINTMPEHSNDRTRGGRPGDKVRVAIIGVGNCASALVQGVTYYQDADEDSFVPGLMHVDLGGYHVRDVEFSAAFDIDVTKVGADLSEAIFAGPNNTYRFTDVPHLGVPVHRGMTHDGLGKYQSQVVTKAPGPTADIVQILRETRTDVVVSYLPVGSEMATKWYVEQVLEAGCAFVNCIPVFIAREAYWQKRFEEKGLPIVGDDIKSQVGATITHRMLTRLFADRGVRVDRTYQLNFGGNTDFLNMLERERLDSKKVSKTNAVTSQMDYDLPPANVHVGPSDYVPWLEDRKWCHIRIEGTTFGDVPLNLELKLEVWDSPNSAGVVIDAVRCCKIALDHGIGGALLAPSAYFMKSPPEQYHDDLARDRVEEFIGIYGKLASAPTSVESPDD